MRVLVVSNPNATATTVRERDVLAHSLGSMSELEIVETANRGHAAALACRAMRDGVDVVVALGGDGTVNEVVNGLLTDGVHDRVPVLGIVPAGSTNVFARALGLPDDRIEATGALLEGMRTGSHRAVSLGMVDDRWFVFGASVGYPAAVVDRVERHRRRGTRSTHALYARLGVREFFRTERHNPKLHVELSDGTTHDGVYFVIVANSDPWTYLGNRPLRPTPGVTLDTDLAMYARRRMSSLGLLFSLARLSGATPRVGNRGAYVAHKLETVTVRADEPMPVEVDGDYLAPREKLMFRSVPQALRIVI